MNTNDVSALLAKELNEVAEWLLSSRLSGHEHVAIPAAGSVKRAADFLASRHPQPVNEPMPDLETRIAQIDEIADGAWGDNPLVRGKARDEAARLRAASIPAPERSKEEMGVKVKPLIWLGEEGPPGKDIRAYPTPEIQYTVRHLDMDTFDVILDTDLGSKWFRNDGQIHASYAQAKAAAQADYEKRILSALETPPLHKEGECLVCNGSGLWAQGVDDVNCHACKGTGKAPQPTPVAPVPVTITDEAMGLVIEAINEELIEADVDYPAGRDAGHRIEFDEASMASAIRTALSVPVTTATRDVLSKALHESMCAQDIGGYLSAEIDAGLLADVVISALSPKPGEEG